MVFGLGPMGCIPLQRALSLDGKCQNKASNLAVRFNKAATTMLADLETKLPNASYKFGEAYDLVNDVITNPQKYGMYITKYIINRSLGKHKSRNHQIYLVIFTENILTFQFF